MVQLYGSLTDVGVFAFVFVQSIGAGGDEVIECPSTTFVLQALVYGAVSDEGIFVGSHSVEVVS